MIFRALLELSDWVERGIEPPASTTYHLEAATQLHFPSTAGERGGFQPVSELRVLGKRIDVSVRDEVEVEATIDVPPPTGDIVIAQWDFEGLSGKYQCGPSVSLSRSFTVKMHPAPTSPP